MINDRLTPSQTMLGARELDRPHSLAQESEGQTPGLFLRKVLRKYYNFTEEMEDYWFNV